MISGNTTVACLRLATDPDKIEEVIQHEFGPDVIVYSISKTDLAELSPLQSLQKLRHLSGETFCIASQTLEKRPCLSVLKAILLISGKHEEDFLERMHETYLI